MSFPKATRWLHRDADALPGPGSYTPKEHEHTPALKWSPGSPSQQALATRNDGILRWKPGMDDAGGRLSGSPASPASATHVRRHSTVSQSLSALTNASGEHVTDPQSATARRVSAPDGLHKALNAQLPTPPSPTWSPAIMDPRGHSRPFTASCRRSVSHSPVARSPRHSSSASVDMGLTLDAAWHLQAVTAEPVLQTTTILSDTPLPPLKIPDGPASAAEVVYGHRDELEVSLSTLAHNLSSIGSVNQADKATPQRASSKASQDHPTFSLAPGASLTSGLSINTSKITGPKPRPPQEPSAPLATPSALAYPAQSPAVAAAARLSSSSVARLPSNSMSVPKGKSMRGTPSASVRQSTDVSLSNKSSTTQPLYLASPGQASGVLSLAAAKAAKSMDAASKRQRALDYAKQVKASRFGLGASAVESGSVSHIDSAASSVTSSRTASVCGEVLPARTVHPLSRQVLSSSGPTTPRSKAAGGTAAATPTRAHGLASVPAARPGQPSSLDALSLMQGVASSGGDAVVVVRRGLSVGTSPAPASASKAAGASPSPSPTTLKMQMQSKEATIQALSAVCARSVAGLMELDVQARQKNEDFTSATDFLQQEVTVYKDSLASLEARVQDLTLELDAERKLHQEDNLAKDSEIENLRSELGVMIHELEEASTTMMTMRASTAHLSLTRDLEAEVSSAHLAALESQLEGSIGDGHLAMLTATELEAENMALKLQLGCSTEEMECTVLIVERMQQSLMAMGSLPAGNIGEDSPRTPQHKLSSCLEAVELLASRKLSESQVALSSQVSVATAQPDAQILQAELQASKGVVERMSTQLANAHRDAAVSQQHYTVELASLRAANQAAVEQLEASLAAAKRHGDNAEQQALLQLGDVRSQMREVQQQLELHSLGDDSSPVSLAQTIQLLTQQLETSRLEAASLSAKCERFEQHQAQALLKDQSEAAALQARADELEALQGQRLAQVMAMQQELTSLNAELTQTRADLVAAIAALERANARVDDLYSVRDEAAANAIKCEQLEQQLHLMCDNAQAVAAEHEQQLQAAMDQAAEMQQGLQASLAQLEQQRDALQAEVLAARAESTSAANQCHDLAVRQEAAAQQLEAARKEAASLAAKCEQLEQLHQSVAMEGAATAAQHELQLQAAKVQAADVQQGLQASLSQLEQQLGSLQSHSASQREELIVQLRDAEAVVERLQAEVASVRASLCDTQEQYAVLQTQCEQQTVQVAALTRRAADMRAVHKVAMARIEAQFSRFKSKLSPCIQMARSAAADLQLLRDVITPAEKRMECIVEELAQQYMRVLAQLHDTEEQLAAARALIADSEERARKARDAHTRMSEQLRCALSPIAHSPAGSSVVGSAQLGSPNAANPHDGHGVSLLNMLGVSVTCVDHRLHPEHHHCIYQQQGGTAVRDRASSSAASSSATDEQAGGAEQPMPSTINVAAAIRLPWWHQKVHVILRMECVIGIGLALGGMVFGQVGKQMGKVRELPPATGVVTPALPAPEK